MSDARRPTNTPEGHTPEEPAPSELGKLGTPGAGMTPDVPRPADAEAVEGAGGDADSAHATRGADAGTHHDPATHMDAHTALSDEDHGHAEPRVGPVDWTAWGYAAIGTAAGLLIVALFYLATI